MEPEVLRFRSVPLGEPSPPAPKACIGRDDLIEKVVGLADNLESIALVGGGGIGKTTIALTVLHHHQIKKRFGENRRFIRCDQFPASCSHFLTELSKVIGAEIGDPEELVHLQPFLSSREMLIILDNAESILDPQGTDAQEIYSIVDKLSQFKTICLIVTSRIATVPQHCICPEVPRLSMDAARDIFYRIYNFHKINDIYNTRGGDRRSSIINNLLQRMDFHALSITLLAVTASHNPWDCDQLVKEWNKQPMQALQTNHNKSLATTIELSLASPIFSTLGPNARELLGVLAFFPKGIDEKNLDWLFPAVFNRTMIFHKFLDLSLAHRRNGFITMLAPVREYFSLQDPRSSPLLCATRDRYFNRLSVDVDPDKPGFTTTQWIISEDVNVEHLLDVFTSIDRNIGEVWNACHHFMRHLYWHKPRQTILRSKVEALPDDHPSKPKCLSELSRMFGRVQNHAEQIRLLTHTLELNRQSGNDTCVAQTLQYLSDVNRLLGHHKEGIRQAEEAFEPLERAGDTKGQTQCLNQLAWLFLDDKQLDAAENAASRAMDLVVKKRQKFLVCQLHRVLGKIYYHKGRREEAIQHFETALEIASPPQWHDELFWIHYSLAELFGSEDEFDDANTHINQAKSHAVDDSYRLGRATDMQASVLCLQLRFEDAKLEALHAIEIYERCGAARDALVCMDFLQMVERAMKIYPTSFQGEAPDTILHPTLVNSHFLA